MYVQLYLYVYIISLNLNSVYELIRDFLLSLAYNILHDHLQCIYPFYHKWCNSLFLGLQYCVSTSYFLYPSVDKHLSYFYDLAIRNRVVINADVRVSGNSCGHILSNGIAGSSATFLVSFLRVLHVDCHRG